MTSDLRKCNTNNHISWKLCPSTWNLIEEELKETVAELMKNKAEEVWTSVQMVYEWELDGRQRGK